MKIKQRLKQRFERVRAKGWDSLVYWPT